MLYKFEGAESSLHILSTMAFKVQVVSVILFICLIDSLDSASVRMKRADEAVETTAVPDTTVTDKSASESSTTTSTTKSPLDISGLFDNIGQIFKVNHSPNWVEDAHAWFTNTPGWLGGRG